MRLILTLGAALAATTMVAHARTEERSAERTHVFVRHDGHGAIDADNDGWISRAESGAAADRLFSELDRNDDARLNEADHQMMEGFELRLDGPGHPPEANDDNCTRTESGDGANRQVTIVCNTERGERRIIQRGERDEDVIIRRHGEGHGEATMAPLPPHPPHPPRAPMFVFMSGEDSEADLNNDGAISQDEFRTQHLRMFDAQDANGDGRVRAHRMPEPPTPPTAPTPPSPPRRG